jgi:cytochrome oxidase Cu insertion factor (SCO1/SenC/PrrC family)
MGAVLAALLAIFAAAAVNVGGTLPAVTLVDQNGMRVRTDAFGSRIALLSFVSTRLASPTFCPAVTAKFLYLQQHLPRNGYALLQITRDPSADSPRQLRAYAQQFGARSADWRLLTGSTGDVARLIEALRAGSDGAVSGDEKLYAVSGGGELLGVLPAGDWSPADALTWAEIIERSRSVDSATYDGHSASAGAASSHATLRLAGRGLRRRFDLVEYDRTATQPIREYAMDMTKLLHLIVVSDDFRDFQHVHPVLQPNGHFRLDLAFPRPGLYHLYADATPMGRTQSVFRFDAGIGAGIGIGGAVARPSAVSRDEVVAGPYTVRLSAVRVAARQDAPLLIAVQRGGLPALDLHPYLGAFAHVVALGISDLSYMHAHPMAMQAMGIAGADPMGTPLPDNAAVPATMTVHLNFPRPGRYALWVQFRGGQSLYAAPFVVQAQ